MVIYYYDVRRTSKYSDSIVARFMFKSDADEYTATRNLQEGHAATYAIEPCHDLDGLPE
jgi:hypothetical protein